MILTKKKKILLFSGIAAMLALILCIAVRYTNPSWGFARKVSQGERDKRLSLVQTAEKWLGCNEADGSHMPIIDLYNSQEVLPMEYEVLYTDSWCATFVTACAMEAGLTERIPPECGCQRQIDLFRSLGRWQEKDTYLPLPGDIIYYDWDEGKLGDCSGWSDHVGIVTGTCWPYIRVIEGNKEDAVDYRIISIFDPTIRGYGLPDYS